MDLKVGRSIRALRVRRGWRQSDLAQAAGCSRSVISRVERGELSGTTMGAVEAICRALGADLDVRVRWHGEALDRLLDEAHAGIVERFVRRLRSAGWESAVEVTFSEYGERGSVDVLGWHPVERALLVGEVKSVIPDAQATLLPLDRKGRLGAKIGRGRGWDAVSVSRVLIVRDGSTNRRRVADLDATFRAALPVRGAAFRAWLRSPTGPVAALVFLPDAPQKSTRRTRPGWQRVNRPNAQPKVPQ
jgi:transcriptional regulator with XRE-family HTH domain